MPKHLSLGTVVEKNRIASKETFLLLAEVDVKDPVTGLVVETIRLANNNEDVIHKGQTYTATSFTFEAQETSDGQPELSCSFRDPSKTVMAKCEEHGGGVGWQARFKMVNSADLDAEAEIEEMVYILSASAKDYSVDFTLGARNPLTQRFPRSLQWRDKCRWKYKSPECGYAGPEAFCDYTLQGPDGCSAKGNEKRYGGLPGIRPR